MKKAKLLAATVLLLLGTRLAAQTTFNGAGTWSGTWTVKEDSLVPPPGTEPQLPQNWVNTHEGDPANGVYDETVYLGMTSNGCPANGGACDYVGTAGLQASMDDWASQTMDKSRHVIVTHGSDFQGTGTLNGQSSGVLLLKSKVIGGTPTNKFIVYESDSPLTADRLACAHGIQDDLPGATDVGFRNNRCDGTCVGGYRTGTGGACVGGAVNSAYNDVTKMWTITATVGVGSAVARGPLVSGYGASHIVLRDLEAHHTPGSQAPPASTASAINIDLGSGETSANNLVSHFYIDRAYIHEDVPDTGPTASTNSAPNAIKFNCNYCGITNTYFDGILRPGAEGHIIAVTDSTGPMKIVHNWTEGSSSSLFVGGAVPMIPGTVSVSDLEVRRNRFSYPASWLGLSGYGGNGMVRKNGLEIKEGHRILLDGNIIENADATGGQKGPLLVMTVRSCSGGDCDNYAADISDVTVSNGVFRHGCQGSQGDGRSGVTGSGNSVSEGAQRWKYDNNLWYDIQRTQTGCFETGMNASNNNVQKFNSGGSSWTGCTATRQANGLDAVVDCGASPDNIVGQRRHLVRVGDLVQVTGCADATFNTGSATEIGRPAIAPTDPLTLQAYYRPATAPGTASTTGCVLAQYQGFPRDVSITHTTVVANWNGTENAYPFASGSQVSKPSFTQRFTLRNNIGIGNGWGTSGTGNLEGTVTETSQFDASTLVAHHNVWPTRLNTKYTDFMNAGSAGVNPPSMSYFPVSNHCTGAPDANCVGMAGNSGVGRFDYNLGDWHDYRLCRPNDANPNCQNTASWFFGKADDGGDMGFDPAEVDAAQTSTRYRACADKCGVAGPYDDNGSWEPVPVAELYPDLAFGNQVVGTTSAGQDVELENSGGATLTISTITISGPNPGNFSKTTTCGATLAANSSCTITIRFTPSVTGQRSAILTVTNNATPAQQSVDLNGTGVNSAPAVTLSPGSLSFGPQVIGTSSSAQGISLQNTGGSTLTISSFGLSGTNVTNFSQGNNCGSSLAAGVSCTMNVTFTPLSPAGGKTASVTISDNAAGSPHTASLTGAAVTSTGAVTIYPVATTMPGSTRMPLSCDVQGGGHNCTFSVSSGGGSIASNSYYQSPTSSTTAIVRATSGTNYAETTITVSGTTTGLGGDCASPSGGHYAHQGNTAALANICTMAQSYGGNTITRKFIVYQPSNYVAGQSPLVVNVGNTSHPFSTADSCRPDAAGSETGGWVPFALSVPTPPVIVCVDGSTSTTYTGHPVQWSAWGTTNQNWVSDNGTTISADEDGFIRTLVFSLTRDLNLDPHKVILVNDDFWAPAVETSIRNSDIVAVVADWTTIFGWHTDTNWNITWGHDTGTHIPNPVNPLSAIFLASRLDFSASGLTGQYYNMCGSNLSGSAYHPLTHDDILEYFADANGISSFQCGDSGNRSGPNNLESCTLTSKQFCQYSGGNVQVDANGIGLASTLEVKLGEGGKGGSGIAIWKMVGNKSKSTPFCSFNWNGTDTYCLSSNGALPPIDLRDTTSHPVGCNWAEPCNHFVDPTAMPNSTTGYDIKSLVWKFALAHWKK
jgi:ASPM-SPD-2-Hydin domain-containing protein